MKNNTIWEFYLMVPRNWTNKWLMENYPAYKIHIYSYKDELEVPSIDTTENTSLVLYAIAISKEERDAFKAERDMSKFICKKSVFPDTPAFVEYTSDYSSYLFDPGNKLRTRVTKSNGYRTKFVYAPRSLIVGERSLITAISEFIFDYDFSTYDVFEFIFGESFADAFSEDVNYGNKIPLYGTIGFIDKKYFDCILLLEFVGYLNVFTDLVQGNDDYLESLEDLKLGINVDEELLFCKFFGNTLDLDEVI